MMSDEIEKLVYTNKLLAESCKSHRNRIADLEDKERELRRCLKSLVEVTKHLNLCPGVMSECEDALK